MATKRPFRDPITGRKISEATAFSRADQYALERDVALEELTKATKRMRRARSSRGLSSARSDVAFWRDQFDGLNDAVSNLYSQLADDDGSDFFDPAMELEIGFEYTPSDRTTGAVVDVNIRVRTTRTDMTEEELVDAARYWMTSGEEREGVTVSAINWRSPKWLEGERRGSRRQKKIESAATDLFGPLRMMADQTLRVGVVRPDDIDWTER